MLALAGLKQAELKMKIFSSRNSFALKAISETHCKQFRSSRASPHLMPRFGDRNFHGEISGIRLGDCKGKLTEALLG